MRSEKFVHVRAQVHSVQHKCTECTEFSAVLCPMSTNIVFTTIVFVGLDYNVTLIPTLNKFHKQTNKPQISHCAKNEVFL